jgi:hypothetical protein
MVAQGHRGLETQVYGLHGWVISSQGACSNHAQGPETIPLACSQLRAEGVAQLRGLCEAPPTVDHT